MRKELEEPLSAAGRFSPVMTLAPSARSPLATSVKRESVMPMPIFSASVFESFLYLLSKGALDWGPLKKVQRPAHMIGAARTASSTVRRVGLEGRTSAEETQIMIDEGLLPAEEQEPATSGAH